MCGIFLGLGDEGLDVALEGLSLRHGGVDPLVEDQGRSHVGEESLAVTALATKVIDCFIVPHCYTVFFLGSILYLVTSIPNESFIFSTRRSISLSDLRPKLRNFMSSALE